MDIYLSLVGSTYTVLRNVIIYYRRLNPLESSPIYY